MERSPAGIEHAISQLRPPSTSSIKLNCSLNVLFNLEWQRVGARTTTFGGWFSCYIRSVYFHFTVFGLFGECYAKHFSSQTLAVTLWLHITNHMGKSLRDANYRCSKLLENIGGLIAIFR